MSSRNSYYDSRWYNNKDHVYFFKGCHFDDFQNDKWFWYSNNHFRHWWFHHCCGFRESFLGRCTLCQPILRLGNFYFRHSISYWSYGD